MIDRQRIESLVWEPITVVPYDPSWPERYLALEDLLKRSLPPDIWTRISHIGSTSVPGMSAKPIIDMQVEVTSSSIAFVGGGGTHHERPRFRVHRRPTMGEQAPFYAWFIGRNASGQRTAHIHMVEPDAASEDRILFRDFLRSHPQDAQRYERD